MDNGFLRAYRGLKHREAYKAQKTLRGFLRAYRGLKLVIKENSSEVKQSFLRAYRGLKHKQNWEAFSKAYNVSYVPIGD